MNMERPRPAALTDSLTPITGWKVPNERFFETPEAPGKVIRWEEVLPNTLEELPYVTDLLEELEERYDIPTVHPRYVMTGEPTVESTQQVGLEPNPTLITVSDRIFDAVSSEDMLEVAASDASVAAEFDGLATKLLSHLDGVIKEGGVHAREFYQFHQYVYSPSQPEGKKLVLVDVEPILQHVLPKPFERIEGSAPAAMIQSLAHVAKDIIDVEEKTGTATSARIQLHYVLGDIDSAGSYEVETAKQAIVLALEGSNPTILDFIFDDGDDEKPFFGFNTKDSSMRLEEYIQQRKWKGQHDYQPFRYD